MHSPGLVVARTDKYLTDCNKTRTSGVDSLRISSHCVLQPGGGVLPPIQFSSLNVVQQRHAASGHCERCGMTRPRHRPAARAAMPAQVQLSR